MPAESKESAHARAIDECTCVRKCRKSWRSRAMSFDNMIYVCMSVCPAGAVPPLDRRATKWRMEIRVYWTNKRSLEQANIAAGSFRGSSCSSLREYSRKENINPRASTGVSQKHDGEKKECKKGRR